MDVLFKRGIVVQEGNKRLILDPETPKTPIGIPSIVTHAHSDHTAGMRGGSNTYCTQPTLELFEEVFENKAQNISLVEFNEPFEIDGFEIEFLPAGHLLGAAQILVRKGEETLLYTGDFCPEQLLCVDAATLPREEIDCLVIETTYGDSSLKYEERSQVRMKILTHTMQVMSQRKVPVYNVAHIGGAQEIIRLFNQLSSIPVFVHEKIARACRVYDQHLPQQLRYEILTEESNVQNSVVLLPRAEKQLPLNLREENVVWGIISGLTARFGFRKFQYSASLSSHANFYELVDYVQTVNPRQVLTHYNFAESFANELVQQFNTPAKTLKQLEAEYLCVSKLKSQPFLSQLNPGKAASLDDFF